MKKFVFHTEDKKVRFFLAFVTAIIGGITFTVIHSPIPWLLGPMICVFICSRLSKIQLYWPSNIRNTGLIIVGYSIGLSFTKGALLQIAEKLPSMLCMTITLVVFCAIIALAVSKLTGVDYPTVLTGSIPGGLSQMIIFAEEVKGIDITTVTFLQVARLMMIIFFVPFLIFGPFFNHNVNIVSMVPGTTTFTNGPLFPNILLFAFVCLIFAFMAVKWKFPTPFLLGPILGTAMVNITGLHGPALPTPVINFSQFMIGGYIGLLLKPEKLEHKVRIITLALISGMVMIIGSLGLSMILVCHSHINPSTSFLSVAPGGMDQMGILAQEVQANLSLVTGYQIFRLFFIYFAVPPLLRLFFKIRARKAANSL
ncbi:AbrB family transcriptional regulator [Bacillus sp. BRMEA1]|uniref:AbrB family transcriptional regulator n=1 Tax=Neobacillus endophyticus TaxID=2738405 RepID=UPI001564DC90|nr:AbrB family transcriptional regulator [Neobacillus endophyticus]NRD79466.1 AbrB family transcriptional regulator [Neobacillus endophyticus]